MHKNYLARYGRIVYTFATLRGLVKVTYKDAGVDLKKVKDAQRTIGGLVSATHRLREGVLSGHGHYAGLIEIGENRVLALHTDGVGTKVLVAQMARRFDTIGIDCIAMNVNDIICVGAEPIAFVDYIALRQADEKLTHEIMKGLVTGAEEAQVAIVGGETAVMPDLIAGNKQAFDLAGTALGIANKNELVLGDKIQMGDVIVGVESNGLHSNGFTLARKVLLRRYKIWQRVKELGSTLADELLKPTRIYVRPVMEVLKGAEVHGLAHITGGAFTKLTRLNENIMFKLDNMPEPQQIFKLLQTLAGINDKEMYRTFNMGIGFCAIVPDANVDHVMQTFKSYGIKSFVIGTIADGKGVYIGRTRIA
ncbi:MAG: phosphoribosylformylglycinamidine cyclo-ligase [Nitrososphaerales archaeon]